MTAREALMEALDDAERRGEFREPGDADLMIEIISMDLVSDVDPDDAEELREFWSLECKRRWNRR